jgi:hypothetical protein
VRRRPLRNPLLVIDGVINLALGAGLVVVPSRLVEFLGLPPATVAFYPSILGAVLVGVGLALLLERSSGPGVTAGLGLVGAVCINLCGGLALAAWLLVGRLHLPTRGTAFLWALVVVLIGLSAIELAAHRRRTRTGHAR